MVHDPHGSSATGEKTVLAHDPVPGYPAAFAIVFGLGVIYLAWILLDTL